MNGHNEPRTPIFLDRARSSLAPGADFADGLAEAFLAMTGPYVEFELVKALLGVQCGRGQATLQSCGTKRAF
jgi:hypothetical protein